MKHIEINNTKIPALGFGTWQLTGEECSKAVKEALNVGYRHIDTAQIYENEKGVGEGLQKSGVNRNEIFLTTKIWMSHARDKDLQKSMKMSLDKLDTDYVDLVLMHWPVEDVPFKETFRAFEDIKSKGMTRNIGVSNFTVSKMKEVKKNLGIDIICNQVEYHPSISQKPVLDFIWNHNMFLTAYSPLGRGEGLENQAINDIAEQHGKTPAQIILAWLMQQENVCAIPKSGNSDRIKENFDVFDIDLSQDEMSTIFDQAREDGRLIDPEWAPDWDNAKKAA